MSDYENPYLTNRKDWTELCAKEKSNAIMWRNFGILSILVSLVAIVGMIYTAKLPDEVPFIFKEDGSGGITALGIPNSEFKADNRVIANQLASFIFTLRQVSNSDEVKRGYISRVKMMSTASLFHNMITPMLKEQYRAAGNGNINIRITTILPVAKNTWEIDWEEYTSGASSGRYKAILTFTLTSMKRKTPMELIWNPVGILVKDLTINKVIGSS